MWHMVYNIQYLEPWSEPLFGWHYLSNATCLVRREGEEGRAGQGRGVEQRGGEQRGAEGRRGEGRGGRPRGL